MSYYFNTILEDTFDNVEKKVREELQKEGFGVLTEINVSEKFKEKLNKDFRKYKILGACNPAYAFKALHEEDKVGTMLPCNVIIQQLDNSNIEVAAVNPIASMQAINNENLKGIATEIQQKLQVVIDRI